MPKQYSITDARNNLPSIVREAESGYSVELTRRGRPVAVLLSTREFQRLTGPGKGLWQAIQEWRDTHDLTEMDLDDVYDGIRDKSPGRDFRFDE